MTNQKCIHMNGRYGRYSTNVIVRSLCVCGSKTECGNGGGRIKYTPMKLNPDICRISPFTVMLNEFQCKPNHVELLNNDRWITLALSQNRLSYGFNVFLFSVSLTQDCQDIRSLRLKSR